MEKNTYLKLRTRGVRFPDINFILRQNNKKETNSIQNEPDLKI